MLRLIKCFKEMGKPPNFVDVSITCLRAINDDCPRVLQGLVDAFLRGDETVFGLMEYSLQHDVPECTKTLIAMYDWNVKKRD